MYAKGKVLLQLFNKSKLRNGTKTFLEPNFFSVVRFKKLGFSAPLSAKKKHINTEEIFLHHSSSTFFEFSSSLLLETPRNNSNKQLQIYVLCRLIRNTKTLKQFVFVRKK